MSLADTTRWLGHQESQTLQFKSSPDARGIATSVCAMLNTDGGVVAVGVADDGAVIGVDDAESKAEEIDRTLRQRISPAAALSVINTEADEKPIILIDVPNGPRKPYVVEGKIFVRVGEANHAATADDINRLIQDRIRSDEHWERKPAIGMTIEDLDAAEIERTMRLATEAGRFDSTVVGKEDALRRLNLLVDGRPIQAAVVAFGSQIMPWYPQCSLRLARFRGVTKNEFVDQRIESAHAFKLFEEASAFLKQHVPIRGTFRPDEPVRQDRPLYPILALREALVNALCHRDYAIPGGAVSVAIFDDRLEVASTGTLPIGLSVADLKQDHFSQPRNPLLADLFYRRGLIELWGRGTQNIVRLCVEAGCPEPRFEQRAGEFVVRFLAPNFAPNVPAGVQLSPRQAVVFGQFLANPALSLRDVRDSVDPSLSDSTIRNVLNSLRDLGLIEAVGVRRGAFWRLVRWSAD